MKRKIIKIISLLFIVLLVFEIYVFAKTNKINYIALGDFLAKGVNPYGDIGYSYTDYIKDYLESKDRLLYYTKEYTDNNLTTSDLLKEIKNNTKLKKDLRESDLVTISIGINDFLDEINFKDIETTRLLELKTDIDKIVPKIEDLLKEIRKYAKNDIVIIGYYNPILFLYNTSGRDLDTLFAYIDNNYNILARKYECNYVSIYQLFKNNGNYLPNPSSFSPNLDGYKDIANKIIKEIDL